jgi:hypothetical protein
MNRADDRWHQRTAADMSTAERWLYVVLGGIVGIALFWVIWHFLGPQYLWIGWLPFFVWRLTHRKRSGPPARGDRP